MKIKVDFTNELPFMIQLPNDTYPVNIILPDKSVKTFQLNLSDEHFRLHVNPFANASTGTFIEGIGSELEQYVTENNCSNYAFSPLKSYITCALEEELEINDEMLGNITDDKLIERLKTLILQDKRKSGSETLDQQAIREFSGLSEGSILNLKINYLINKNFSELSSYVYSYHEALNKFIIQYSYSRNDFFVEPLTMHTLNGTFVFKYIDGKFIDKMKCVGKAPSVFTHQHWMPEIEETLLNELKANLLGDISVPSTNRLIITAKNLGERGEYRSAIIESSAALEIAVEEKIVEKMRGKGISMRKIQKYLKATRMQFQVRCDSQLKTQTGFSFVKDNAVLWGKIKKHRDKYRNKIAHSWLIPNAGETEVFIRDFEEAVDYINSL
ncbi:hypothetical protein [Bacillus nitratireducens]|uniref:hypothetical protein n=1 Tax=Bacillus nitratireducens TaxID=2026193 RepID=UPI000BFA4C5A|nr:hypothetical protein [Bacillus nitratireducens]PFI43009.1 hypothetical protein COI72_03520 [Bacillus cereus]